MEKYKENYYVCPPAKVVTYQQTGKNLYPNQSVTMTFDSLRWIRIRSSDIDSTGFWPQGSLHTLSADGHI